MTGVRASGVRSEPPRAPLPPAPAPTPPAHPPLVCGQRNNSMILRTKNDFTIGTLKLRFRGYPQVSPILLVEIVEVIWYYDNRHDISTALVNPKAEGDCRNANVWINDVSTFITVPLTEHTWPCEPSRSVCSRLVKFSDLIQSQGRV